MKILCTGGAGFIGSHLVDKLLEKGHQVSVIDDLSGGKIENIDYRKVHFYEQDCRDENALRMVFDTEKPEIVFHLSANAAENKAQFSPVDITSRNYDAFIKVLTSFIKHKGKRFVFTSSIAVYGALQTPFKETDKPEPEDLYGITKLAAEESLKVMSKVHRFEYVIARPHNVYGPRQNMSDPYRNVVTIWMNSILRGEPMYIYGDGEQERQFTYIEDVIEQLYKCGFSKKATNKIFNIGSLGVNNPSTINLLAKNIQKITDSKVKIIHLPERLQEVKEAIADHTRSDAYLSSPQKTSWIDSLFKTWIWCESQGPQELQYTEIEIPNDRMPKNWRKHD